MPFRTRRLRVALVFLATLRLVINTGHRFVYPFLPAIARGLGISLERAGFLVSARWAAGLGTPALVGFAGRGERRRRLLGIGLSLFAVGAAITAASNVYVGALVGFVLMGIAKPVFDVGAQSYLADRVPYDSRARYLGALELTWAGGLLVGAPLAGWLISRSGWTAPFWVIAAATGAAVVLLGLALESDAGGERSVSKGLAWDRHTIAFMVMVAIFSGAAEVMFVVMGAWLEDSFGLSLLSLGGLATLIGLAELTGEGAVAAFADRVGKRAIVALGMIVAATGFLLLAAMEGHLVAGIGSMMVAFLGFELTIVGSIPLASELRPYARARFLAWMIVAMAIGRTAGAASGAGIFAVFGVAGNAVVAAAANLVALGVLLTWVREEGTGTTSIEDRGGLRRS